MENKLEIGRFILRRGNEDMNILVVVYLLTSIGYVLIGAVTYTYDSSNKLNRLFLMICLDLALWALMLTLINAIPDAETATDFRRIATFFWSTVFCLLLHFFLILVKRDRILNKPLYLGLLYLPSLISIYLYYYYIPNTPQDLVKLTYGWAYLNPPGQGFLWDNFLNIYYVSYIMLCIILVWHWGYKSSFQREKRQSQILVSTFVLVFLLGSVTDIILPIMGIPLLPTLAIFFIFVPILGTWYLIKKYRLMNLSPENVVSDVLKTMREGIIITNQHRAIKNINIGALHMMGYREDELKDKDIGCIFPEEFRLSELNQQHTNEMHLQTKSRESLPVLLSTTTLSDEWEEPYGSVMIFQDLTEIKRIQRELQESHDEMELKVLQRTRELKIANNELKVEIAARIEMENKIKKLALYDYLTGLPNRRQFNELLNQRIHDSRRSEVPLSVMFLDLDSFKLVNDTLGHVQGDKLLKQVASRLGRVLRINDTIARAGGDEFLIAVQNTPDGETSELIARKIIEIFRRPFKLSGNEIHMTASIGIAVYPVDGEDVDALIKNADIAMYRAKEKGKNKYEICTYALKNSLTEIMKLTNSLYRALARNELELYYQPQVDTYSGQIVGVEALIRWNHPEMGMISPAEFIPVAEKTGLIIPIGEWVLETACAQNKAWQNEGVLTVPMAVNLSVKQFIDHNIVDKISRILKKTGLEPQFLELEITESVLMKEVDFITETLAKLNELGVRISIDDFGTKYSSLNYIKQLPIDRIKIAMTFVQGININPKDEAIIYAIIALANSLGVATLAEGVETASQLEFFKKVKCNSIQGFYFYKPMTSDLIQKLLREKSKLSP